MLLLAVQTFAAVRLFLDRGRDGASFVPGGGATGPRFFYHGAPLAGLGAGCRLDRAHARNPARSSPRVFRTNSICRQAFVQYTRPWMPIRSRRIVCSKPFPCHMSSSTSCRHRDFVRRYALPAVESHPASWRLVHTVNGTRIFAHALARGLISIYHKPVKVT